MITISGIFVNHFPVGIGRCYRLNIWPHTPQIYTGILIPNVIVFGDEVFGR